VRLKMESSFTYAQLIETLLAVGRSDTFYYRSDFVVMSLSGTIIGLITFDPQGIYQALAAGFGWAGAMNVLLKTDPPHNA
jgi:hypothetical protein